MQDLLLFFTQTRGLRFWQFEHGFLVTQRA